MPTTLDQLAAWLAAPEGPRLEFKEAKGGFHFDKLVDYCVAVANEGGGIIILGVTDRRPRRIVGTQAFAEPGRTEAGLHDRLGRRIPVEEIITPEGRVLVVHVPARLPGTAWQINGRYLKRAGDELTAMGDEELRAIFAETGPDFSAQPCPGATVADLAPASIATFRERWAKKTRDDRRLAWSDAETLANAELLVDGVPTYAALILFGTRPALGRHLAQAELVFEYRSTEAAGPAADREEYREGFFAWYDALWTKINLRNDKQSYQDGLFRLDIPTSMKGRCARRCSMPSPIGIIAWVGRCSCASTPIAWKWSAPAACRRASRLTTSWNSRIPATAVWRKPWRNAA